MRPVLDRFHRRFPLVLKVRWLPDGSKVEEKITSWRILKGWWRFRIAQSYPWQKNEPIMTELDHSTDPPGVVEIY